MVDEKFTPWEGETIEFISNPNWVVERGSAFGMYSYTYSGVRVANEVDAFQLVEWGMARVIYPTLMTPWSGADIEFIDHEKAIRNPTDFSEVESDRTYLYLAGGVLYVCNKYQLIKENIASAGEECKKAIDNVKITKKEACESWAGDDIFIVGKTGVTITKGTVGNYSIKINGGFPRSRTAQMLIEDGLAVRRSEMKLDILAKRTAYSFEKLRLQTCDYWFSENPEKLKDLVEIALIYHDVEHGLSFDIKNKIKEIENNLCSIVKLAGVISGLSNCYRLLQDQYSKVLDLMEILEKEYSKINYATGITQRLKVAFNDAKSGIIDCQARVEKFNSQKESANKMSTDECKDAIAFLTNDDLIINVSVFPEKAREELSKVLDLYNRTKNTIVQSGVVNGKLDFDAYDMSVVDELNKFQERAKEIARGANALHKEKMWLDSIQLGPEAKKKKANPFAKTYKPDGITLITAVKIKHLGDGIYEVECADKTTVKLNKSQLVYLGLAK